MKTIGVLGGLGPQATMDFEQRLHREAQSLIPQDRGAGYPTMVVYYCRHAPMAFGPDGAPVLPMQPHPGLLEGARKLGQMADFLVVTSNGTHFFQNDIESAAGKPVLSIIDVTVAEVRRRGWQRVGVLGASKPVVYTRRLDREGIGYEILAKEGRDKLDTCIFALMEGRDNDQTLAITKGAVEELRARGVDGVILGCTEIPLLLREHAVAPDLINPGHLLARAAVEEAIR